MTSCLLDDRERGLSSEMAAWPVAHLPVGDIWIGCCSSLQDISANGLVIERKTADDLEASILDGRYREQRSRLISYTSQQKAHPMYIIEGDLDRLRCRLPKSVLLKHLTRLALRYHITVFQTACMKETAELCELLKSQWEADPTTFQQPKEMTYIETRGKSRQENSDSPAVFAANCLMGCRGISAAAAQAILAACGGSLAGVFSATQETLAGLQVGKQKLGPARAGRLYSLLHPPA